jgi:RNA polymerase sigma factor (sigma-70 family)
LLAAEERELEAELAEDLHLSGAEAGDGEPLGADGLESGSAPADSPDPGEPGSLPSPLLERLAVGDPEASAEVFNLLYEQLRAHAGRLMRGQRPGHTLQATALVGEAYLRLVGDVQRAAELRAGEAPDAQAATPAERRPINGKEHFIAMAAKAMRWVLIDHARSKRRIKRGRNATTVPLDQVLLTYEARDFDLLALDEALDELAETEPQLAQVVELRFFAGLSMEEIAPIVGLTLRTLERKWHFAKTWLFDRMA